MLRKIVVLLLVACFASEQVFAQVVSGVNLSLVPALHSADRFRPAQLRSLIYNHRTGVFDLALDKGDAKTIGTSEAHETARVLMEYFRVGVALADSTFWVNLRPDMQDRVIDPALEKTEVGRILLAADVQLKKDLAAATSPDASSGKEYWSKLYAKAQSLFGASGKTIPTLSRPWIVPGEIIVRESGTSAYIYKASLKVKLEQDYLKDSSAYKFDDPRLRELNEYSSSLIRELILPGLTKKVNSSKEYAPLRQVYYSLILAQWFKRHFRGKSVEYAATVDTGDLSGIGSHCAWTKESYVEAYRKSFAEGEYSREERVTDNRGTYVRRYASGGIVLGGAEVISVAPKNDEVIFQRDMVLLDGGTLNPKQVPVINGTLRRYYAGPGQIKDLQDRTKENGFVRRNVVRSKLEGLKLDPNAIPATATLDELEAKTLVLKDASHYKDAMFKRNQKLEFYREKVSVPVDFGDKDNWRKAIYTAILADIPVVQDRKIELADAVDYMIAVKPENKIDDIADFIDDIGKVKTYVHIAGLNGGLYADMLVFGEFLLKSWLREKKLSENEEDLEKLEKQNYRIVFAAKEKRVSQLGTPDVTNDATMLDVNELLDQSDFKLLKMAKDKGVFEIIPSGSEMKGTDLRSLSDELKKYIGLAQHGEAVLGAKGEENNATINLLNAEHYRFAVAASVPLMTQVMAELPFADNAVIDTPNKTAPVPYPFIIRVPAGMEIANDFYGMRKTRMSILRFYKARNIIESNQGGRVAVDWPRILEALKRSNTYKTLLEYAVVRYFDEAWSLLFDVKPQLKDGQALVAKYNRETKGYTSRPSFFDWAQVYNDKLLGQNLEKMLGKYGISYEHSVYRKNGQFAEPRKYWSQTGVEPDPTESSGEIADFSAAKNQDEAQLEENVLKQIGNNVIRSLLVPLDKLKGTLGMKTISAKNHNPDAAVFLPERAGDLGLNVIFTHTGGYFNPPALYNPFAAAKAANDVPLGFQGVSELNAVIDMRIIKNKDGTYFQTLPIYNKAFQAYLKTGDIRFGRVSLKDLQGGTITVNDGDRAAVDITIDTNNVNPPMLTNRPIMIFTPQCAKVEDSDDTDDTLDAKQDRNAVYGKIGDYWVGEGRFNIVIFNEKGYIFFNKVYLQPEGVILSFTEEKFEELFGKEIAAKVKQENDTESSAGEIKGYAVDIGVNILGQIKERLGLEPGEEIEELYGGMTLVWTKENAETMKEQMKDVASDRGNFWSVADDIEKLVRENFRAEGWYNDYSKTTQETQLQRVTVRGPRCMWVKTKNYLMPLVIEGRQDTSTGANFVEAVILAYKQFYKMLKQKYGNSALAKFIEEIAGLEIFNWDGGSSVGLGAFIDGKGVPVAMRAPGPSNGKGGERPVPLLVAFYSLSQNDNEEVKKDGGSVTQEPPEKAGGIDFKTLPVKVSHAVKVNHDGGAVVSTMKELNGRWRQIQIAMVKGEMPYIEIKKYVGECMVRQDAQRQLEAVSAVINNILKQEEADAVTSSPELIEVLNQLG